MPATICFLRKIHYLTNEERNLAPKIKELLDSEDYESNQLGRSLFFEIFGEYYLTRSIDEDTLLSDPEIWNISHKLKYIISRNFVYERCYY